MRVTGDYARARRDGAVPDPARRCRKAKRKSYDLPSIAGRDRHDLRALPPRHREGPDRRAARPAADRRRRLERRHEPRRPRGPRRKHVARLLHLHRAQRLRADLPEAAARPRSRLAIARSRGSCRRVSKQAWDGEWFRRGYYDDGRPLGSAQNDECAIDSISQSWALLSGAVPRRFAERAMDAVRARLIDRPVAVAAAADAAVRQVRSGSRLHQGLSAGHSRERRAIHARRGVGVDGGREVRATATRPPSCSTCSIRSTTRARREAVREVSHRAVRARRRRLRAAAACRPRRLELVYRIGGLALSRRPRAHPRPAAAAAITSRSTRACRHRGPTSRSRGGIAAPPTRSSHRIPIGVDGCAEGGDRWRRPSITARFRS